MLPPYRAKKFTQLKGLKMYFITYIVVVQHMNKFIYQHKNIS